MTEREVFIRCDDAHEQASQLRNRAGDLRSHAREYESCLADLANSWTGPSSRSLVSEARQRIRKMNNAAARLDEIACAIDKTADLYQKNELAKIRAKKAARRRI